MEEEIQFILDSTKESMQEAINHLERILLNIRAGKANPMMLNSVIVDYYGNATPLKQVANINTPNSRTLSVQPFEKPMIPEIEKGIMEANLGLNPTNNGEVVIINIPPLTEERRRELVKQVKSEGEDAKISIRNTRQDGNKEIKKLEISDDLKNNTEDDIQELTNQFTKKIEDVIATKEKEVLTV